MKHTVILSADGSNTLKLTEFDECYHSGNGAYAEARHIYIDCGVDFLWKNRHSGEMNIHDIGLGTALNCMAALVWQYNLEKAGLKVPKINYHGLEKYPIPLEEALTLNFPEHIAGIHTEIPLELLKGWFYKIHTSQWEEDIEITPNFTLLKHNGDISTVSGEYFSNRSSKQSHTVVMYDTFSPSTQPQLWDIGIFKKIALHSQKGTILTTYCSKGTVKQALREAGFTIERLQGPPGKRHIIRATI